MKRLFKKGLSLLLAVLMVVSMLPTSAWAVTFADGEDSGREETPVVDAGGDVSSGGAHVSGGSGTLRDRYTYDNPLTEDEAEETQEPAPVDPSDPPAELNAAAFTSVTAGSNSGSGVLLTAAVSGPDHLTFLIVPKFKIAKSDDAPSVTYDGHLSGGTIYEQAGGGATSNVTDPTDGIMGSQSLPYAYYSTATTADSYSWNSVTVNWDGTLTGSKGSNSSYTETLQPLSSADNIKPDALNTWLSNLPGGTTLYGEDGSTLWAKDSSGTVTTSAATLPFRIYAIASGQSAATDMDIPTTGAKLKVEIQPKTTAIAYDSAGADFAVATITNQTDQDMNNVVVDLRAKRITSVTNWGNEKVPTHLLIEEEVNSPDILEDVLPQYPNPMGFTEPDGVDASTAGDSVRTTTVTIPAGGSVDIPIYLYISNSGDLPTLCFLEEGYWYNYTVFATHGTDEASGNAGIANYYEASDWTPQVILQDVAGNPIPGSGTGAESHTVSLDRTGGYTGHEDLSWNAGQNCYTLATTLGGNTTWEVKVDGISTGVTLQYGMETGYVTLYKLTVTVEGGHGTVTAPADQTKHYMAGESVNVAATIASGYSVEAWTINGSVDNSKANTTSGSVTIAGPNDNTVVINVAVSIPVTVATFVYGTDAKNQGRLLTSNVYLSTDPNTLTGALQLTYDAASKVYKGNLAGTDDYYVFIGPAGGTYPAYTKNYTAKQPCVVSATTPNAETCVGAIMLENLAAANGTMALTVSSAAQLPAGTEAGLTVTPSTGKGISAVTDTHWTDADGNGIINTATDTQGTADSLLSAPTMDPFTTTLTVGADQQRIAATIVDMFVPYVFLEVDEESNYVTNDSGFVVKLKNKDDNTETTLTFDGDNAWFTSGTPLTGDPNADYDLIVNGFTVPDSNVTIYTSEDDAGNGGVASRVFTVNVEYQVGGSTASNDTNAGFTGGTYTRKATGYVPIQTQITLNALKTVSSTPWNSWTTAATTGTVGNVTAGTDTTADKVGTFTTPDTDTNGPITITANYLSTGGDVTIDVQLNDKDDTTARNIYIWDQNTGDPTASGSGAIKLTQGADNTSTGGTDDRHLYTAAAVTAKKYYVWVGTTCVTSAALSSGGAGVSDITVSDGDAVSAQIDFYTISATAGTGVSSVTPSATEVLKGTTGVTITGVAQSYYGAPLTWTKTSGADIDGDDDALTVTLKAIEAQTAYELDLTRLTTTVTYYGNTHGTITPSGGTAGASHAITVNQGSNHTVGGTANSFTLTPASGWTFDKWNTAANGSGTNYDDGDTLAVTTSAVDLYAIWKENTAKVTIKLDNGTYTAFSGTVTLRNGSTTLTAKTGSGSGVYNFGELATGTTYNIYIDGTDTTETVTTVDGDEATGEVQYYTLKLAVSGSGFVDLGTSAPTSGTSDTGYYRAGTTANIAAAPDTNQTFTGWTGGTDSSYVGGRSTAIQTYTVTKAETLTANFAQGTFTGTVKVTWDGAAPTGSTSATVRVNNTDYTVDATHTSVSIPNLVQGTSYPITVDGHATGMSLTTADNSKTVEYISAVAATDGNGTVTAAATGYTSAEANATTTSATLWVLKGTKVTWSQTPATYYKFKQWEDDINDGNVTTDVTAQEINSRTIRKGIFERKTSPVTVTLRVDGSEANPGRAVKVVVGSQTLNFTASETSKSLATDLEQQATAYAVTAEGVNYDSLSVPDATDGTPVTCYVDFYTATVVTDGNGDAKVTIGKYGDLTADLVATTDHDATPTAKKSVYVIGLKGQDATWHSEDSMAASNYSFQSWDSATGSDTADKTVTLTSSATRSHTAYFSKTAYDTYLDLTINGQDVTGSTADWTVKLGSYTVSYDSAKGAWKAVNVPNTDTTTKWTVTTPHTGDYTETNAGDNKTATLALYGLETVDTAYDTAQATMTANGQANLKEAEVKLNADVTLAVTAAAGYTHASPYWTEGTDNQGTVAQTTYTLTKAITANQTLTPTFTFEATVRTLYNGTVTDPGATDPVLKASSGASDDVTLTDFNGSKTVTGLKPGTTYRIWVNGFDSGKDVAVPTDAGASTTDVPLVKITTAKNPNTITDTNGGTAYIKIGTTFSGTDTSVYVPSGARTGSDGNESIQLKATATGDYKLANTVWTESDDHAAPVAPTAGPSGLTLTGLTDDLTVTANFVKKTGIIRVTARLDVNTDTAQKFPEGTKITLVPDGKTLDDYAADTTIGHQTTAGTGGAHSVDFNLPYDSAVKWDIYVGNTNIADGIDVVLNGNDDGKTVDVDAMYYTVEVKSGGHGDASVTDDTNAANTASTSYAATTPDLDNSIVVLEQTSVTWTVGTAETNYAFTHWDTTTTDTATTKTATITAKDQSHTANFSKTKYTATLDLELDNADVTAVAADGDVISVTLVPDAGNTAANEPNLAAAYNPTSGKWEVNDLPNAHKYTWKVVTSSNNNVTSSQVTQTAADKTIDLFKVSVVTGSDIPAGSTAPKIKGVTTVVEPASATALTLDPSTKNGYTCTGWVQLDDSALPTGLTATTTGLTIDSTYAGTTDGITIKPTFTFAVPVELQYAVDNSPVPGQTVTVKLADGSAATGVTVDVTYDGGTGTTDTDGKFMISGMDPDVTYTIWVNGFKSELALDNTKASTSVAQVVKLHKITAVADPGAAGTAKVNGEAELYVPNKAVITATAPTVTVDVDTLNSGYRWATKSGETLWSTASTDVDITSAAPTAPSTSTTITTKASDSVEADIVMKAKAVKIWTVNVVNQTTPHDGGTLNAPTITSGTGTIGTLTDGNYPNNIVDDKGVINVTAAAKDDFTASWSVAKPDGTALTGKIDAANGGDVTVDQDMTITVSWTANEYKYIFDPNTGVFATGAGADPDLNATTGMVERTATVGTVITKPDDPTKTKALAGVDRNYAFAGWYDDPDAGEGNKITFDATHPTMPSKPTNGKVTVYAHWTPLYTITYDAHDHGTITTQPVDQKDKPAGQYPAQSFTLISADTAAGDTFSSAGLYTEADGTYWMFKGWDPDPDATAATYQPGDNVTLPDPATEDVRLYAIWESQVEVKLGAAADAKNNAGNAPAASDVSAALNGATRVSGHTTDGVFVKASTAVNLTNLTVPTGYIFAYWTASDATGAFDATKSDKVKDATFTPTANTVLTPHYWKVPTLSGTDGYHLNFAKDAVMTNDKWSTAENKKGTNSLPAYTWTQNDAELPTTEEFQIKVGTDWIALRVGASGGDNVDVVKKDNGDGTVTYTLQESYLKTLSVPDGATVADYPVRVVSKTPDYDDPAKPNAEDTTKESKLQIVVTPDPLIEVNILAKGRTQKTQTAKVGDGTGTYDNVHYLDHKEPAIVATNKLTYTWYVSNNHTDYPTQWSYTNTTAGPSASATADATANANANALAKGTVIQGPSTDDTVPVNKAEYKGKWIYAVVAANNTGYGAVITNAIAVDYDAKIAVNQDNAPVPGNKANGYRVFLVPATEPADLAISAEGNLTGTGVVPTTNGGTNNVYATEDSALIGGATYYAYVNKVEGDFTQYEKTSVSVSTQVDTAGTAQIIDFYSVNAEGTDKLNKTDSKGDDVGESFGASDAQLPDIGFTTDKTGGGTIPVGDGDGVLKGSKVTAKTDDKNWQQDYKVNWGVTTTEPTATTPLTYTTVTNQTRDEAFDTGTGERAISQKTWMGAQLEQRVYSVVGNIWATGTTKTAGILTSGVGNVPTLTYGTYRFDGTVSGTGIHRNTVTFTVPKSGVTGAIAGQYVLSAKPKTSPKTTILKLAVGNTLPSGNATADDTTVLGWNELNGTNKDTLADIATNTNPAFTIVVAASTYVLDLAETSEGAGNKTAHGETDGAATTQPVASGSAVATRPFSEDYAARVNTAKAYTFAVTNNGNTTLRVSLKVKKGGTDVYGTGVTGSGILTDADGDGIYEDANGMTFDGLQTSFDLAPGKTSSAIKVTIPSPLGVKDVANYDFEFTSVQKDIATTVYGPSVTYKLTETVTPLEITKIAAVAAGAGETGFDYKADETKLVLMNKAQDWTLTGKTAIEAQGVDLTTVPEVEYTWWRGPYNATEAQVTAAFDFDKGVFKSGSGYERADGDNGDGTYTYHDNDQGKAVYIVARPKGIGTDPASNSGNVIKAAFDFPSTVAVPYDMTIQIKENSDPVANDKVGNYEMYLVPNGKTPNWGADLAGQGILTGTPANDGNGSWKVEGLKPGTDYNVYTNAVGGDDTAANRQDSKVDVVLNDFLNGVSKVVYYHNVVIQNTVADNSPYTIDTSDNQFVNTADGTTTTIDADSGALVKPSASFGGVTVATDNDSAADRWVQKGTTIALSYKDWDRDYKLEWSNAASGTENGNPANDVSSSATVNGANTTVETKLTLNTYTVTMEVEGTGSLDWVTLTDGDHAFTTKATDTTDTSNKLYHATDTKPSAGTAFGADSYTFTVPQGTYTITASTASGTNIDYYKIPITDATEIPKDEIDDGSHNLEVTDNSKNFLIKLSAQGQFMQVEDDRTSSNATNRKVGTASVALVTESGTTSVKKNDDTAGSTITLKLGYNAPVDVMVKASNTSPYSADNNLYKLTWTPAATGNSDKITDTVPDYLAAKPTLYAVNTGDAPAVGTNFAQVKLTVDTGLGVGTHTFTADVSFEDKIPTADYTPKVTYTLTVVVEPATFTDVSISKVNASTADDADIGATMVPFGVDLKPYQYTTTEPNLFNISGAIADGTDYAYTWYATPATVTSFTGTWADGVFTPPGNATALADTDNVLKAGTIANHPGEKLWLVIAATNTDATTRKVTSYAVSDPVSVGFQPKVQVTVDGSRVTTDTDDVTGTQAARYAVTFNDGTTDYVGVWDGTLDAFVPATVAAGVTTKQSFASGTSLTVKVSPVADKMADSDLVTLTGATLTGAAPVATAPYFTVNAVATKAFAGISGLGEEFTDNGTDKLTGPAVSFTYGGTAIGSGTPVLSGEDIVAKTADWGQDYKLTWYTRMDGAVTVPNRDDAYEGTNHTMTADAGQVDHTSASGTGKTVTVGNKLYVGGRLDQNKYTIKATVKGTGTVSEVTLNQMDGGTTSRRSYAFTNAATDDQVSTNASGNSLSKDQYVTFTVVKGGFDLAATPGNNTVISSMVWEETGDTVNDGAPLTGKTVAATGDGKEYAVTINLTATELKLKVADDGGKDAESDPFTVDSVTNGVERYFNYIHQQKANAANPDTYEYELTLTNPGNKDLYAAMDVYYFADPSVLSGANYYDTVGNWEDVTSGGTTTPAVNTPIFTADATTTAKDLDISGRTVLKLSGLMATGSKVAKDNGTQTVGKLTLGTDTWVKDDGAFVFRFKGTTGTASDQPVYVYYVLDLTVDQLPIAKVETQVNGAAFTGMPGVGDKLQAKGYDATNNESLKNVMVHVDDVPTEKTADEANLTANDVHFAWVKVPAGTALNKNALSVTHDGTHDGQLGTTTGTVVSQNEEYVLRDGDQDNDFYLVAFAPNYDGNVTNAKDMVIANVIQAKRTVGVQVSLDTFVQPTSGTAAPGYTIYFVEGTAIDVDNADNGTSGTWSTTWSGDDQRIYQAPVDMTKTYHVFAATTKGGATFVDTGLTVGNAVVTTPVVPYWTVAHTANVAVVNGAATGFKSYLPNGTAASDNAIQGALSVKVSTTKSGTAYEATTLAASVPVLEGMNVQVTVDGTKDNNNATAKESWEDKSDYHTLTTTGWNKDDTATSGSKILYGTTIVSGDIPVNGRKSFSATLAPVLFEVTFKVKDVSDPAAANPPTITAATLNRDTTKEPGVPSSFAVTGTLGAQNGGDGDTVTFTNVPAGDMVISATEGNKTMVVGYTWNDADAAPVTPGSIVHVTTDDAKNKHEGNLIEILEATNMIRWEHNFDKTNGKLLPDSGFVQSNGLAKVDGRPGEPDLALRTGYNATDDTLEYAVRVYNAGTSGLENFRIDATGVPTGVLTYSSLSSVKHYNADGTEKPTTANVAVGGFTLGAGECVEFTITIPVGQAAQDDYYESVFKAVTSNEGNLGGGDYKPVYQVTGNIGFTDGKAEVIYGDAQLKSNTPLALTWDGGATKPTFHFDILTLSGTDADADADAATLALINEKLSLTGANAVTALDAKPAWLTLDENTGAMSFTAGEHATGVNVESKDPDNYVAVDDEVVLYLKATEQLTGGTEGESFIVRYVVDVEPGKLYIGSTDQTQDTDWTFDPKVEEEDGSTHVPYGGTTVNMGDFHYTKVIDQAGTEIVTNVPLTDTSPNTANGNKPGEGNDKSGEVYVGNTHMVTWTLELEPPTYVYNEDGTDTAYPFTVTYKPTSATEKWNYEPNTVRPELNAEKPPEYKVTYDNNGHEPDGVTWPTQPDIVDPDENPEYTVRSFLTKDTVYKDKANNLYYTFTGWVEKNTDPAVSRDPGSKFTPQTDVILVAQWEAKVLNVTYKYNGNGTPDKTIQNAVQQGGSYFVAEADPTWNGRTFLGWSVTGGTPSANPLKTGGTVNAVTTNVVLTARWERDQSKIIYDWNYEGSAKATHTGNTGERDTAVPTSAPTHTGYTWDGKWYAEKECTTQVTAFNFPATKGGEVTYYAKWTRDQSHIDFDLNGGEIRDGGEVITSIDRFTGNTGERMKYEDYPHNPVRDGYTFAGWRGSDGKQYTGTNPPSYPAAKDGVLTITAQWTRDRSTVTFKLDGGSINGETDDIKREGNTGERMIATQFPVPDPVRKGYAFTGWLGEDGKTYDINDRPSYPATRGGNLNVTAQWRQLVQGLKFSDERSNDAAVNDANGKITLVDPDAVLTAPDLQKAFPPAGKVERTGEYIVYLDTEPRYTVALHSVGDPVYDLSVTATDVRGVKYTDLPVNVASFASTDDVKVITLDLEALSGKLWAGEHHILLKATGNTEADGTGDTVTATYELTFVIQKKPIPGANVIPDPNDPTNPGKTKVTDKDGKDLRDPDPKGNTPVVPPVITKTPTNPKPGETYEIKTTLEPDPNYIFEPGNDPKDPTKTPNYTKDGKGDKTWPEGDPDLNVTVKPEDPGADVTYVVTMREPLVTIGAHLVKAAGDVTVTSDFSALIGQELRDYRAQSDDPVKYPRTGPGTSPVYGTDWWWSMGDATSAVLDIQPGTDAEGKEIKAPKFENNKTYVLTVKLDPDEVNYRFADFKNMKATFDKDNESLWFEKDNGGNLTRRDNAAALLANTEGFTILVEDGGNYYLRTYYRHNKSTGGGGGGGGSVACPFQVTYLLGLYGTTKDPVMEMVTGKNVKTVPNVSAITGYKFLGWSLAGPIGDADKDATRTLVDPKEVPIEGDTTFYAVYQPLYTHGRPFHEHYVIGYPNGNFGPSDNINRASVATIIARAVLPNFVEGADYGNPGGYSDVSGHWASSAIAYCTRYGVFKGYEDGTFRPDQPISRQELVLTLARLNGMQEGNAPFSDLAEAGDWAKGAIYTAYVKGWVNGYTDGTFRPTNPIARDETVKIFNAYLYRGVNAEGLSSLTEYVHSGVASNNTENGTTEYMTWPDVPKTQWAYYEIIEAANDHEYKPDETKKAGYTVPEVWTKCWIDEKWRYNDNPNDGGPANVTMALLRKYGVIA